MSLKEIAHRAGTSVSTVSRVLNQPDYKCKNPEGTYLGCCTENQLHTKYCRTNIKIRSTSN